MGRASVGPPQKRITNMKIYNEAGQLSDSGKKATEEFRKLVKSFLCEGKSDTEIRLIGSLLCNVIGDETSKETIKKH
jgi:hypothetical protein